MHGLIFETSISLLAGSTRFMRHRCMARQRQNHAVDAVILSNKQRQHTQAAEYVSAAAPTLRLRHSDTLLELYATTRRCGVGCCMSSMHRLDDGRAVPIEYQNHCTPREQGSRGPCSTTECDCNCPSRQPPIHTDQWSIDEAVHQQTLTLDPTACQEHAS